MASKAICSIPGCDKKVHYRMMCAMHAKRCSKYGDPHKIIMTPRGEPMRFILETAMAFEGDGCLIWPYARSKKNGYPLINIDGRVRVVSNYVCELAHGPAPTDKPEAAHSCGNGSLGCISPKHVSWKDRRGNIDDTIAQGKVARAERLPQTKLTRDQVREIRAMAGTTTQTRIARLYSIKPATVCEIIHRRKWAWLD